MPIQSYAYILENITDAELGVLREIVVSLPQKTSVKIAALNRKNDRMRVEIVTLDQQLIIVILNALDNNTRQIHPYTAYQPPKSST